MKKFYVFLVFLLSVVTTSGQEQHIYSSKENIFNNWIKRSGETAYQWGSDAHRVGALLQTYWYEIRNFNCW